MTGYLPPSRPTFRPEPPRKSRGYIAWFIVAGVSLILAGWSWDQLHSSRIFLMSQSQANFLSGLCMITVMAFLVSIITGLVLLSQRHE